MRLRVTTALFAVFLLGILAPLSWGQAPPIHLGRPDPACTGDEAGRLPLHLDTVTTSDYRCVVRGARGDKRGVGDVQNLRWMKVTLASPYSVVGYMRADDARSIVQTSSRQIPISKEGDKTPPPPQVIERVDTIPITVYRTDTLRLPGDTVRLTNTIFRIDTTYKYVEGRSCWHGFTWCTAPLYIASAAAVTCGVLYLFHEYCFRSINENNNYINGQRVNGNRSASIGAISPFVSNQPTRLSLRSPRPIALLRLRF